MNKPTLLIMLACLIACLPLRVAAQDPDAPYLAGAVPEKDGRVVFSKEFVIPGMSQDMIYERVLGYLEKRMAENENTSRVVYQEPTLGKLAAMGEEYLVFSASALSLDRALINYQISVECAPEKCTVEIEKIRYTYREKEKYTAEEWIADKYALNKTQTKLVRGLAKWRRKTVDFANDIFAGTATALSASLAAPVKEPDPVPATHTTNTGPVVIEVPTAVTPQIAIQPPVAVTPQVREPEVVQPSVTVPPTTSVPVGKDMAGYRQVSPDKLPGNIIKMLNDDWMLITAGNEEQFNMMTASWGGLGVLYGKPVAICYINPARYTYQLMEKGDTYTFTFYTEAYREALQYCGSHSGRDEDKVAGSGLSPLATPDGSMAFSEAWLIIECKKLAAQSLIPEAIYDEKTKEQWTGKPMHKIYIGEIVNVWMK